MSASRHHIVAGLLFAFFGVLVPLLNYLGLVADTTLNLWGRYFCFAIVALGMDLIWGFTGILSLCQAFFFCLGGYAIGMHMLLKTGTKGVYGSALPDFMVWNRVEELPLFWEPFHSLPLTLLLGLLVPGLAALVFGFSPFAAASRACIWPLSLRRWRWRCGYCSCATRPCWGGPTG